MVVLKKVAAIYFRSLKLVVCRRTCKTDGFCYSSKRGYEIKCFYCCGVCEVMASIPQGAFAACKMSGYKEKDMAVAKVRMNSEMPDMRKNIANKKLLDYSPVKYNSKLMNSIWGLYNRYSPHNIKGNEYEVEGKGFNKQQPLAVASHAIEKDFSMAVKPGKEWNSS